MRSPKWRKRTRRSRQSQVSLVSLVRSRATWRCWMQRRWQQQFQLVNLMLRAEGTFGAATALNLFAERCAGRGRPLGFVVVAGQHVELLPDLSSGRKRCNKYGAWAMHAAWQPDEWAVHDNLHAAWQPSFAAFLYFAWPSQRFLGLPIFEYILNFNSWTQKKWFPTCQVRVVRFCHSCSPPSPQLAILQLLLQLTRYTTLHYITFHYTSLHYSTLHSTRLQLQLQLQLRSTTLHYIKLHFTTLNYTTLHSTTPNYITLHYIRLNDHAPQIDR